jgi:hypothetical protein
MTNLVEQLRVPASIDQSDTQRRLAADEIERLRADRDSWADQADARVKDCVEYISEIERLRGLLRENLAAYEAGIGQFNEWIQRVREALGDHA